ncbi:MAG: CBS domain-containing protein [Tateyamaria sp.]|jgi:CBS domain-containing protein|nr:CBS domain-containing protein [Tateyamaria sp.]MDB2578171.1 CBS domain-containing protein [Tateyamaria sp.]MDG1181158.1 CBS domain-containing protein [Tateyamaria sp.]MDG1334746.1 CBS domain-containing protein [Tateyamaria sp.]MDG2056094.1 CBS domain-containing protein [Tateyamaria sp.]
MLVHQILKSKPDDAVVTVPPGTLVSKAAKMLAERKIGTVVVSKDGSVADGILSERDIVRVLASQGGSILLEPVERFMTKKLVTCTREDSADHALEKMTSGRFRHMPVVEAGQLIGLITLGDVVKARLAELAMEKDALQGMIMGH